MAFPPVVLLFMALKNTPALSTSRAHDLTYLPQVNAPGDAVNRM